MKVTLIYPGYKEDPAGLQEPLGLLYIAAALKNKGFDVELIDLTFGGINNSIKAAAKRSNIFGFTSTSGLFPRAVKALKDVKESNPDSVCIIGGAHVIACLEETLNSGFDYAVIGEGESTILDLLDRMRNNKDPREAKGIAYKLGNKVITNQQTEFISDLDKLAFPARELWDYKTYFSAGVSEFGIMATRGCPFNCAFCKPLTNKLFGNKVRKRSAKNVVDEIESICKQYGAIIKEDTFFWFRDDTLTFCGISWFKEFGDELKRKNIKLKWGCHTRVDQVSFDLLKVMKDAGLFHVSFGVESGSQKILNFYRKGITPEQTINAFDVCHKLGLSTFAYIMVGAPMETREDLELTYQLIKRIKPDGIDVYTTTPHPGNDLHDYVKKNNLFNKIQGNVDYWSKSFPIKMEYISEKDLVKFRRKVYFQNGVQLFVKHVSSLKKLRKVINLLIRRPGFMINYAKRIF